MNDITTERLAPAAHRRRRRRRPDSDSRIKSCQCCSSLLASKKVNSFQEVKTKKLRPILLLFS